MCFDVLGEVGVCTAKHNLIESVTVCLVLLEPCRVLAYTTLRMGVQWKVKVVDWLKLCFRV